MTRADYNSSCSLDFSIFLLSRQSSTIVYVLMGFGNILFSVTALVGNTIILLSLRRCSSLHPSSKSLFFSLAMSDLAIGLVGQPLFAAYTLAIAWDDAGVFCAVGLPYSLVASFLALVSFWSLTVIALDRCLALILGFRYRAIVTVRRVVALLVSGWLFIAFCTASITLDLQLRQIISNLFLLSCLLLSSYFYIKIYVALRRHKLRMQSRSSFSMSYYRQSLDSMFLVFCLFLATYLPFVCALATMTVLGFNSASLFALDITSFVGLLNSSLNPVVYFWRIRDIKREVKQLIQNVFPCCRGSSCNFHSNRVVPVNRNSVSPA